MSCQAGIFCTISDDKGVLLKKCASNWWDMSTMALIKAIGILFNED